MKLPRLRRQPHGPTAGRLQLTTGSFLSFQLFFENFLAKLAVDSLKMEADDYNHLRKEHNLDWIIDELQRRSREKGLRDYSLRALREALLKNSSIANRTFEEWQPPQVRDMFR